MQETVRDAKCDVYHTMAVLCGASHSRASVVLHIVVQVWRGALSHLIVWSVIQVAQLGRAPPYRVCCDIEHITDCPWRMSQGMRKCDVYHIVYFVGCMSHMKLGVARITL